MRSPAATRTFSIVAFLLGHSSIAITGDVYGHTSDDTARAAVPGLAGRLGL
jgi:integrase